TNPNDFESIKVNVADEIDPNAECTVEGKGEVTLEHEETRELEYECVYSKPPAEQQQTNIATAIWDPEEAGTPNGSAEGEAGVDWEGTEPTLTDNCVEATDTLDGTTTVLDEELCESETYEFAEEFNDPAGTCTKHENTAEFVTLDTDATGS